jgi:D-glycero-alpha-D-manno-heptose 1-phosphate guanylyltransferase
MTSAIILAGGLGTRLRSAVPDLPKPMAPIAGRPFLAHQMDHWIAQGIAHFVLSVGYRHEAISGYFGPRYRGAALDYVIETTPLGTGGGLLLAAAQLPADEPALLLNGDTYFDVALDALQAQARRLDAHWCFALFRNTDPERYMGVGVAEGGRITALRSPDAPLANGGVYLFKPSTLQGLSAEAGRAISLENDIFPQLFRQGDRFAGLECPGAFIDIGVPHDYQRAASVLPADHLQEHDHAIAG